MEQLFSKALDNDFQSLHNNARRYNLEFDMWKRMAGMVMADMSFECGWRGKHRDMNFNDFDGYYMEYDDEKVSLWNNGVCEGEVIKTDDGVRIDGFDDVKIEAGDTLMIACGQLCRSEENMSLAMSQMHQGNDVLIGLRYKDSVVYAVDECDIEAKAQLVNHYENVRFVSEAEIYNALNAFRENHLNQGPEPIMPKIERCFYDGMNVRTDSEYDPLDLRDKEQIQIDKALFEHIREEMKSIRKELDTAAGVAPEHQPFVYKDALYPTDYFRNDLICICHNQGMSCEGGLLVRNGKVGLYKNFYDDRPLGQPDVTFKDAKTAVNRIRGFLMSPQSIKAAQKDYQEFVLSERQSKGMKI